jgi:energy-converting hydrogenase Eha subunit B
MYGLLASLVVYVGVTLTTAPARAATSGTVTA